MDDLRPLTNRIRRIAGLQSQALTDLACDRWQVCPGETREVPPVICLPDQPARITRTEFAPIDAVLKSLSGDPTEYIPATTAYLLRDVDFIDGVLYAGRSELHLRRRQRRRLGQRRPRDSISGAMFETWVGNRWFGNWLLDDCLTYRLAETAGSPVTSMPERGGHVPRYEELLSIAARRIGDVHFDELVIFDDHHNNSGRLARAQDMRRRLLKDRRPRPNPGVFLYRGRSGDARILENEDEIAEKLEAQYGFRVMFAEDHSVDDLMEACGETEVVAGVEGSQLNHGIAVMPPGGTLLTLQPPDRATTAMKLLSDRWQQRFALIVGIGTATGFRIGWDDVRRTLEMIL
ncbi:glycosyltransferase family 61 protein [Paracoccus spongiarum]|uniref:Glycosyltransferase family 61 protein n=1 Tax=Paracoccus spongiarum TaxID=3064387 RepID=A0ABT9J8Q2_9RHOB|nr:glycosyltransferase family 61 protein [Paracoccus sp. 2205BS29-5]MDP5306190.1 glycosyltransferase family 61 protein [Paracoccus sp. 2205BS29-5]